MCLENGLFLAGFPPQPCTHCCSLPCATCPTQLTPWFNTHIIFGEKYKSWSSLLYNFLHFPVTSFLWGPDIFLSRPFSNTLSLILKLFTVCILDQYGHLLESTKCTISYTYNSTDITPTRFGMNMTFSGSPCANFKTSSADKMIF